jgi:hypothetical protein
MSLTSYQAAPPCNNWEGENVLSEGLLSTVFFENPRILACQWASGSLFSAALPTPGGINVRNH